jgi:alpha-amylase
MADHARAELLQGQSNDCYWHGVFGGIYITHMRLATCQHLIAAEDHADAFSRAVGTSVDGIVQADTDLDGVPEILVTSPGQIVVLDPAHGGGIGTWDVRAVRHALASVMRRRPEAYHARLIEADAKAARTTDGASETDGLSGGSVPSIHDVVRSREPGLAARLHYDAYERRLGLVHLFAPGTTAETFAQAQAQELGDAHDGRYEIDRLADDIVVLRRDVRVGNEGQVRITKQFTFDGNRRAPGIRLDATVDNPGPAEVVADLAIEWPVMLLGGGANPAAWYEVAGERSAHDGQGQRDGVTSLTSGNDYIGIQLTTTVQPAATMSWSPIETVSNSEFGFERTYQGSALVAVWPIRLGPGERISVAFEQQVQTDRDEAAAD